MNSVIIPTYCPTPEVEEKLEACIASLEIGVTLPYELIVVEQGPQCINKYMPSSRRNVPAPLRYMYFHNPIGYARAVNYGARISNGEYLFIVNNDIFLPYEWDRKLVQAYESLTRIGLLSPIDGAAAMTGRADTSSIRLDTSWWSCVCIRMDRWKQVGELNENELNYRFHDQDWSIRCKQAGYHVCRTTGVCVTHDESSTYRHMQKEVDEEKERAYMIQKYGVAHFYEWVARHGSR